MRVMLIFLESFVPQVEKLRFIFSNGFFVVGWADGVDLRISGLWCLAWDKETEEIRGFVDDEVSEEVYDGDDSSNGLSLGALVVILLVVILADSFSSEVVDESNGGGSIATGWTSIIGISANTVSVLQNILFISPLII